MAGGLERRDGGALGGQLDQGVVVADRCRRGGGVGVVAARLQRQRSLARGRGQLLEPEAEGDLGLRARAGEGPAAASTIPSNSPSDSLRSRVSTLPCSSTSSRSGRNAKSWERRRRLAVPTRAPCGHLVERRRLAHVGVDGIRAAEHAHQPERVGTVAGQVLGRVDRQVRLAVQHRPLHPAHEALLVAGLAVARLDGDDLGAAERLGDELRLREREPASPRSQLQPVAQLGRALAPARLAQRVAPRASRASSGALRASRPNSSRRALTYT